MTQTKFADLPRTGDYDTDCAAGRDYAQVLIRHMAETGETFRLGWVIRDAMQSGAPFDGVMVGFAATFADHAVENARSLYVGLGGVVPDPESAAA